MSELKTRFSDLSKEKQLKIRKIGGKFVIKSILTGMNYGGLIFFSNLLLVLANGAYFNSNFLLLVSCVIADTILIRMMSESSRENLKFVREEVNKVVESE